MDSSGGSPVTICDAERGAGGTWNRDGTIVFAPSPTSPLYRVPASGGQPVAVTKLDASRQETAHRYPQFLPDGRHLVYTALNLSGPLDNSADGVRVTSLDGGDDRLLVPAATNAVFASGRLLLVREGTLFAQLLDKHLEPVGEPVAIAQGLGRTNWARFTSFTASGSGLLVYAPSAMMPSRLLWFDRGGKLLGSVGEPTLFLAPRLSPDGQRIAVGVFDPAEFAATIPASEIWLYNAAGTGATKLAFGQRSSQLFPVWSPMGTRITFQSLLKDKGKTEGILVEPIDGRGEETLLENTSWGETHPEDWSRDGRFLSFTTIPAKGKRLSQIWVLEVAKRKASPFLAGDGDFSGSRFSPDGRWLAYDSNESGRREVYVQAFPGPGGRQQVSAAGGDSPCWRGDGREIFYLSLR